ncbi:MAG: putative lipoprotein [Gammaproteobacteria bacterium]
MSTRSIRFIIIVIVLALSGCSISESSSKIVSSPFESSSRSFSGKEEDYRDEVKGYTYAYIRSSTADYDGFRKGLAEIAEKYGITNWEVQPLTYNAIGSGLKKAGLKGIEYETFKKNLGAGEITKMQEIDRGYQAGD